MSNTIRRTPNRRLAPSRPMTGALMAKVRKLMQQRGVTQAALAKALGVHGHTAEEWLSMRRSAPGSELTLRLLKWCEEPTAP